MLDRTTSRNVSRAKAPPKQNPKSEYRKRPRGPKQTETRKTKIQNPKLARLEFSAFRTFEFVSNFGFRIWDLTPRLCANHLFSVSVIQISTENFK